MRETIIIIDSSSESSSSDSEESPPEQNYLGTVEVPLDKEDETLKEGSIKNNDKVPPPSAVKPEIDNNGNYVAAKTVLRYDPTEKMDIVMTHENGTNEVVDNARPLVENMDNVMTDKDHTNVVDKTNEDEKKGTMEKGRENEEHEASSPSPLSSSARIDGDSSPVPSLKATSSPPRRQEADARIVHINNASAAARTYMNEQLSKIFISQRHSSRRKIAMKTFCKIQATNLKRKRDDPEKKRDPPAASFALQPNGTRVASPPPSTWVITGNHETIAERGSMQESKGGGSHDDHDGRAHIAERREGSRADYNFHGTGRGGLLLHKSSNLNDRGGKVPLFSQLALTFLNTRGISTVKDLMEAESQKLALEIYASEGFRIGCSLTAWNLDGTEDEMVGFDLAGKSVVQWKVHVREWLRARGVILDIDIKSDRAQQPRTCTPKEDTANFTSMDSFLSQADCHFLRTKCHILTIQELLNADPKVLIGQLGKELQGSSEEFRKGMVYSWLVHAREKKQLRTRVRQKRGAASSEKSKGKYPPIDSMFESKPTKATPAIPGDSSVVKKRMHTLASGTIRMHRVSKKTQSIRSKITSVIPEPTPTLNSVARSPAVEKKVVVRPRRSITDSAPSDQIALSRTRPFFVFNKGLEELKTPLSYPDMGFLQSVNILTDEQLMNTETASLAFLYAQFCGASFSGRRSARSIVTDWKMRCPLSNAGMEHAAKTARTPSISQEKEDDIPLLDNVSNFSRTYRDPDTGLPGRELTAFDCINCILYDFKITIKDSSIKGAGKGAFITLRDIRVPKDENVYNLILSAKTPSSTRGTLEAVFKDGRSGVDVKLTGKDLHGDEIYFGKSGLGAWRQCCIETDFVPAPRNSVFCSLDEGSGLILIGRYAPLLPEDRKIDLIFEVKDFIFSHEPSSWRFDVPEELYNSKQVVDFTDDQTGEPHRVAKENVPMYVNEVGHDPTRKETVLSRDDNRSVSYYFCTKEPMRINDTMELLVDYKEEYEDMRERKGYGKANLTNGLKCDRCDFTRMRRNTRDRSELQDCIPTYTIADIKSILSFIDLRVWGEFFLSIESGKQDDIPQTVQSRHWVARRRVHWLALRLKHQLQQKSVRFPELLPLLEGQNAIVGSGIGDSKTFPHSFCVGMLVFVNEWQMPNDPRPAYTGVAVVDDVVRVRERNFYDIRYVRGKTMTAVPEEALSQPSIEDVECAEPRLQKSYYKWKEEMERPELFANLGRILQKVAWKNEILAPLKGRQNEEKIRHLIKHDIAEELATQLLFDKSVIAPFDESVWCRLSITMYREVLLGYAAYELAGGNKSEDAVNTFSACILKSASVAGEWITKAATDAVKLKALLLHRGGRKFLFGVPLNPGHLYRETTEEAVLTGDSILNVDMYKSQQCIFVLHAVAESVFYGNVDIQLNWLGKLCEAVGLREEVALRFKKKEVFK